MGIRPQTLRRERREFNTKHQTTKTPMTRVRLLLLAVLAFAPLAGCESLSKWKPDLRRPTGELKPVEPQQLVNYVNGHASRMQTLSAEVQVTAGKSGTPLQATLDGNLSASQPRNFRMKAQGTGLANVLVDLGSNRDQFWIYLDGMGADKLYVFASHTDFETGKARNFRRASPSSRTG